MDAVKEFFKNVEKVVLKKMGTTPSKPELSTFQKKKLLHEFHTFFDLSKDGTLEWKDLEMAREKICELSGWKLGSEKYLKTQELFTEIWRQLQDDGDADLDGKITADEWLSMWERFNQQYIAEQKKDKTEEKKIPEWLERYIEYKFNLYDRTGDGLIDSEEFEYVLSDFGVPPKDARTAFILFSNNHEQKIDLDYFRSLSVEYYRSDDPSSLGNFITGRLIFDSNQSG